MWQIYLKELGMKKILVLGVVIFGLVSINLSAGNIGFGTIKAIKVYNFNNDKRTRIFFDDDATHLNAGCANGAYIMHTPDNESFINKMMSVAISAYMANKKVRIYSNTSTCEADFISLEKTYP